MNMSNPQMPPGYGPPPAGHSPYEMPPGMNAGMPVQSVPQAPPQDTAGKDDSITVGPFILNYPKLFTPEVFDDKDPTSKPYYSCELMVYQSHPDFQKIYSELFAAANPVSMSALKIPVDSPKHRNKAIRMLDEKRKGEYPPGFFLSAKSYQPVNPVVGNPPRLAEEKELYSGCEVYAMLKPYAYSNKGEGVSWWVNGIWKTGDGTRLVPERDPIAGFSHLLNTVKTNLYNTAAPAGMQTPYSQQQMPPAMPPGYGQAPPPGYGQQQMPPGYGQAPPQMAPPQTAPVYPQQMPPGYGQPQQHMAPPMPGFPVNQLPY